jgi:hypothetical protein
MTTILNATSASGLVATADNSTTLALQTNGTTGLYMDASQNVGIGTTSPFAPFTVSKYNASGGQNYIARFTDAVYSTLDISAQVGINNLISDHAIGFYTSSTEKMRIDTSGNLLVGTTSSTAHLTLKQSSNNYGGGFALVRQDTTDNWQFRVDGGSTLLFGYNSSDRGSFNSGTGAYTALSDRNKKKDFEDSTIGLSAVMQLKPTLYRMIDEEETSDKHLGFIAQEVKEVIPPAYVELGDEDNKFIGLDYQPIVASLVKAIQELTAEVEALKAKVGA